MARPRRKVNHLQPAPAPEMPKQRIYNVGGYIRLSVEDSGHPGKDTIEKQRDMILEYINAQPDMRLYELFCDNGRTGMNFERPGFEALMEKVRAGKIDCIVVKDLSRFGRNYLEAGNYLERIFPFLDVRFVAITDSFDTLTAERSGDGYIIPLKNILNSLYSKDISRKVSSALTTKRENGEFIGTWAAYGYRKCAGDKHRIEPDEETAPIVRDIFQWRLSGMSVGKIARKLNEAGIPSPSRYHYLKGDAKSERYANSRWQPPTVKKILEDEVYLGHMVQGRRRSNLREGRKQQNVPKLDWIIVRDTHTPLIDVETFQAVQSMAGERRDNYYDHLGRYDSLGRTPNILKGLLYCADCKRRLSRYKSVTNHGTKRYYVFICPTHSNDPAACPKKYIHETEVVQILWETLHREIELAADMEKLIRQYQRSPIAASRMDAIDQEAADARKALDRAKMFHDSLYQNYVNHMMLEREYLELKKQYKSDMEQARERLEAAERRRSREQQRTERNPWLTAFSRFQNENGLTEEMAHALIERVEVDASNHIAITLRYQDEYRTLLQFLENEGKAVSV